MKKLLIYFFTFLLLNQSYSQDVQKIMIAIPGFETSTSDISHETISAIHQRVIDAFVKNSKFSVVERNQLSEIRREIELQKSDAFMDGKGNVSDKVKNSGASYLLTGIISRVVFMKEQREKTKWDANQNKVVSAGYYDVYLCTIELNLKLIDVTTSQIVLSEVLSSKNSANIEKKGLLSSLLNVDNNSGNNGATSQENAYNDALQAISNLTTNFIKKAFPNVLTIAEISSRDKSGNAEEVLLVGDFTDYMEKSQRLYVKQLTESEINGRKLVRRKLIGEVKIIKVEDGGFISCKVKSGEEEITKAFDSKMKIEITENQ